MSIVLEAWAGKAEPPVKTVRTSRGVYVLRARGEILSFRPAAGGVYVQGRNLPAPSLLGASNVGR